MAHALGGWMDLPHGECNAMLLAHVVEFNFFSAPERYRRIAETFGLAVKGLTDDAVKEMLVAELHALRRHVGLVRSLEDYGVGNSDLHVLAEFAAADPCMATNPVQPTLAEIERTYGQTVHA
jgi:alcohol dehydrogenase class IV